MADEYAHMKLPGYIDKTTILLQNAAKKLKESVVPKSTFHTNKDMARVEKLIDKLKTHFKIKENEAISLAQIFASVDVCLREFSIAPAEKKYSEKEFIQDYQGGIMSYSYGLHNLSVSMMIESFDKDLEKFLPPIMNMGFVYVVLQFKPPASYFIIDVEKSYFPHLNDDSKAADPNKMLKLFNTIGETYDIFLNPYVENNKSKPFVSNEFKSLNMGIFKHVLSADPRNTKRQKIQPLPPDDIHTALYEAYIKVAEKPSACARLFATIDVLLRARYEFVSANSSNEDWPGGSDYNSQIKTYNLEPSTNEKQIINLAVLTNGSDFFFIMRASLLQTPSSTRVQTGRLTRYSSARKLFNRESSDDEPEVPRTPKSRRPRRVIRTPKVNVKLLTPTRGRVDSPLRIPTTPRDRAKHALAQSAAPESLPCRGKEFQTVYDFVREKISSKESGWWLALV